MAKKWLSRFIKNKTRKQLEKKNPAFGLKSG